MQRLPFLKAKATETRSLLNWLDDELNRLRTTLPEYSDVIEHLQDHVNGGRERLSRLDVLITAIEGSADASLVPRAMTMVHLLEAISGLVAVTYLPALERQGPADRFVRGLMLCAVRAGGLSWIQNVVVRLDGPHAAVVTIPELPIIYAPPRHAASLADMPGIYHELGHAAFAQDSAIGVALRMAVASHFDELRRMSGQLNPDQRAVREDKLRAAEAYWNDARLAELFCDVFATVVCGPAHYASFADLGLRHHEDPFAVTERPHPPLGARAYACYEALTLPQRQEPLVRAVFEAWRAHEQTHAKNEDYERACDNTLIRSLVQVARDELSRALPTHTQYVTPTPSGSDLETIASEPTLENLLNQAAAILFLAPDRYDAWEARAMAECRVLARREAERHSSTQVTSSGGSQKTPPSLPDQGDNTRTVRA